MIDGLSRKTLSPVWNETLGIPIADGAEMARYRIFPAQLTCFLVHCIFIAMPSSGVGHASTHPLSRWHVGKCAVTHMLSNLDKHVLCDVRG
eukprot:3121377-Rhodomonas_salina.6